MSTLPRTLAQAGTSVLLTDFYEIAMLQAYHARGMNEVAVFELFVRDLPPTRNFLLAAGLAQAVECLTQLRFTQDELAWLDGTGRFTAAFLDALAALRFTGSLDALPEGTVCFGYEPILRVTAPMAEAQLVESRLMNLVHFQTMIASKAARCVLAARGRTLIDFGLRRSHGAEAGLMSARASYLAGFAGTATTLAGERFGIPTFGTMAHSFIQAHDDEMQAFEDFARSQPRHAALLIDTYDTEAAAHKAVELARRLRAEAIPINAVRIDSGDLGAHARKVRRILDDGGERAITIFASGNLDESRVEALLAEGAPIDAFGVGTRMNVAADAPFLDCAYKLVEYAGQGRRKRSEGKATWPGPKQVFRRSGTDGKMDGDTVTLVERTEPGTPLLVPVLRGGALVVPLPALEVSRAVARGQLDALPERLRSLQPAAMPYDVTMAPALRALADEVDRRTSR